MRKNKFIGLAANVSSSHSVNKTPVSIFTYRKLTTTKISFQINLMSRRRYEWSVTVTQITLPQDNGKDNKKLEMSAQLKDSIANSLIMSLYKEQ